MLGLQASNFEELKEKVNLYTESLGFHSAHTVHNHDEERTRKEINVSGWRMPARGFFYCRRRKQTCPFKLRFSWKSEQKRYEIVSACLEHNHSFIEEDALTKDGKPIAKFKHELTEEEKLFLFNLGKNDPSISVRDTKQQLVATFGDRDYSSALIHRMLLKGKASVSRESHLPPMEPVSSISNAMFEIISSEASLDPDATINNNLSASMNGVESVDDRLRTLRELIEDIKNNGFRSEEDWERNINILKRMRDEGSNHVEHFHDNNGIKLRKHKVRKICSCCKMEYTEQQVVPSLPKMPPLQLPKVNLPTPGALR